MGTRTTGIVWAAAAAAIGVGAQAASAGLMVEVRLAGTPNPKAATVRTGDVLNLQVWGTVTGADATVTTDGLQTVGGSILTTLSNGGAAIGNFSQFTAVSPFNGTGWQAGLVQDLNGQPGNDVGSLTNAADFLVARAGAPQTHGAAGLTSTADGGSSSFLLGTLTWTATSAPGTGTTTLNFLPRAGNTAAAWREEGLSRTPATSTFLASTTPITVSAVPEPGSATLALLAGVGMLARRRRRA